MEVDCGFDVGPGGAVGGVPDFDDALVCGKDFGGIGGGVVVGGAGGVFEEGQGVNGVAVALVFFEKGCWRAEIVEVDEAGGGAGG